MKNEDLFKLLAAKKELRPELKERLNAMIKRDVYAKHQIILSPGQISKRIWYISKGSAMAYMQKDGKRIPFWFWDEKVIMMSSNSFFKQVPTEIYIELLEHSALLSITFDNIQELTAEFPESNTYIQFLLEEYQKLSEKRILALSSSPEEHYKLLKKDWPGLFKKVPVELIAAFIGVSRKTLNRIRSKNI
jgi:CRP-like cAMP-binding protein